MFPEWRDGPYYTVELEQNVPLKDLLTHLYVLIPVLDAEKHYWVGQDEIENLLRRGEGWLQAHPERELIVNRYLRYQKRLASEALARLIGEEEPDPEAEEERKAEQEASIEKPLLLNEIRLNKAIDAIKETGAARVLDLGCGEGKLIRELLKDKQEELTASGSEGMVVKPMTFAPRGRRGLVQPAIKCRGREYLRIIYGPEYTAPQHLERLRSRGLSTKRSLALREFALGLEALQRFVEREPLRRVHECVFGVLALESEPVDPRL
jgi:hypothetical protein